MGEKGFVICERFRSNQVVNNKVSKWGNCDDYGFGILHLKIVKKSIVIHFLQKKKGRQGG